MTDAVRLMARTSIKKIAVAFRPVMDQQFSLAGQLYSFLCKEAALR